MLLKRCFDRVHRQLVVLLAFGDDTVVYGPTNELRGSRAYVMSGGL